MDDANPFEGESEASFRAFKARTYRRFEGRLNRRYERFSNSANVFRRHRNRWRIGAAAAVVAGVVFDHLVDIPDYPDTRLGAVFGLMVGGVLFQIGGDNSTVRRRDVDHARAAVQEVIELSTEFQVTPPVWVPAEALPVDPVEIPFPPEVEQNPDET